ncbi:MAG TPA: CHASE domain-containing protein [Noviherbaspirillum sp.]|uniref:sensor histidine kinase n=1 Tax=Noviherbaspirillum sp. TaxID=1926288 RepID=UPI002D34E167|nr:CHASE domain-containing protein [Noviherbaspirillum sp.]HYD97010.1 CHASE domain-containing protein [Noviherbaspirillum sp.]
MSSHFSRKPVSAVALLALGAGLAFTGTLCVWLVNAEADRRAKVLERAADLRQAAFEEEFKDAVAGLTILNRFVSGSGQPQRQQFQELATQMVELHPYIQAFSFVRVVPDAQRPSFEAAMRRLRPDFAISEMRDGVSVPAKSRPHYHVIDQIAPFATNTAAFGLDVASLPGQQRALARAAGTGLPSATGMFDLFSGSSPERAFALVMPVYRPGSQGRNAAQSEGAILGYTAAVFRVEALMQHVLQRATLLHPADVELRVYVENGDNPELLYRRGDGESRARRWLSAAGPVSQTRSVDVAGLRWQIVAVHDGDMFNDTPASAWLALASGAVVTALLALYLQSLGVRASELAQANARLREDIAERERIEAALRASEERFHRLADLSSDWYWEQDAALRFTYISAEILFDTPTSLLLGKTRRELPLEIAGGLRAHQDRLDTHQAFADVEYRVRTAHGMVYWIQVSGEPLFDAAGGFLGYRGTAKDISARKLAEEALWQSQAELRELAAHQARVKEEERKWIAREIHDELGQNLLALRIDVSLLDEATRRNHPALNGRVHALLDQVDGVMRSVRAIINHLRPSVLDLGLHAAIEWQVNQFRQRCAVACSLEIEGTDIDEVLEEEVATSVFRILQEALTNIARHARATQVDIRLRLLDAALEATISDNGIGALPHMLNKPASFGLMGMRERVFALGGEFSIEGAPGKGTTLRISIPTAAPAASPAIPA